MKSNPETDALKHRIRELEDTVVHYQAQEDQMKGMLHRIAAITAEMCG